MDNIYNRRSSDFSKVLEQALNKYRDDFIKEENQRRSELKKEYVRKTYE